ncbi:hypothetical protein OESDEN_20057, partial [Oesophagostomum dentatum]
LQVFRQVEDLSHRLCACCPIIGRTVRLQKKFRDSEIENEKLVLNSPRTKSTSATDTRTFSVSGIGALIMARSSLATMEQQQQVKVFQGAVEL